MERILIRFIKGEAVRFVGHLDLMRVFERAMRRSRFPVAFSQGFNPRPRMAFASALTLGATSNWELCQIDLAESLSPDQVEEAIRDLRQQLPDGIQVPEFWQIPQEKRNPYIQPIAADYHLNIGGPEAAAKVAEVLNTDPGLPWEVEVLPAGADIAVPDPPVTLRIRLPVGERGGVRIKDVLAHLGGLFPQNRLYGLHRARLWCEADPQAATVIPRADAGNGA